jgi:hypothetical protein
MVINDSYYVSICRNSIEKKLQWPTCEEWRDFEFSELADRIFEKTGVQLSTTTLKRFFGKVKYESTPSSVTLNAIARFLEYDNWMEFKNHNIPSIEPAGNARKPVKTYKFKKTGLVAAFTLIIPVLVSGFIFLSGPANTNTPGNLIFTSRPIANGLPNSVVFKTNLDGIKSNNILIQQSWDSTKTIRLQPGQKEATGIYYIPGYFRAKLIIDNKIVKEHDLFIPSNGWMATIEHAEIPEYVKNEDLVMKGRLGISEKAMNRIRQIESSSSLVYHLVQPFKNLQSDDFSFETSFRNTWSEGPAVCKTVKIFILCKNGAFIIPFTIPGCVSDINLKLGDLYLPGKSNDLSDFSADPFQKRRLKVINRERNISIYLDDKLIRTEKYKENAGEIVGFRYSFLGAGEIYDLSIKRSDGSIGYSENFR